MQIRVVPTTSIAVPVADLPSMREIDYQAGRLITEGQIEPLVTYWRVTDDTYHLYKNHPDYFAHSPAIVLAALKLQWPTLMVTFN